MRRTVFYCLIMWVSIALPLNAQESKDAEPVTVCVASAECFGLGCAQRKIAFPERELLAKKLNVGQGTPKFEARDEGYRLRPGCALEATRPACEYLVLVKPVKMHSRIVVVGPVVERSQLSPADVANHAPPKSPDAEFAEQRQQEPLDESSLLFEVVRLRGCQRIESSQVKRLEVSHPAASTASVDWLVSKAAERIRKALERDLKVVAPAGKPAKS